MFKNEHTFKDFDRFFVGFDKVAEKLTAIAEQSTKLVQNYPPFNIKRTDDNTYVVELAVAGFAKQDLEIELDKDVLVVRGTNKSENDKDSFLYKGISTKDFVRSFGVADNIEVRNAEFINGLLRIWLEAITPEDRKPIKVEVK